MKKMKVLKTQIVAIISASLFIISCRQSTKSENLPSNKEEKSTEIKTEIKEDPALNDTIGLYQISDESASNYVVKMYDLIHDIENAMNTRNLNSMPRLMKELSDSQRKQITVQSELSEPDLKLYKVYINDIGSKLQEVGDKMSKM